MTVTLGKNIASQRAQRQLFNSSRELEGIFERLSSGQRINRASDDAAGLAIADDLNVRSRVYGQGIRNLSDGISLLNIADLGLANLSSIVIRLEELAEQAANGVYGTSQRKALDNEAQALSDEFLRIAQTTEFNGQKLFTGENPLISLQGGIGEDAVIQTSVGGAIGTGEFSANQSTFSTEAGLSNAVRLGDLNGDGFLDLVTAGRDGGGNGFATVRLGTGDGSFGSETSFATEVGISTAMTLGDLNGDGVLDLITAGEDGSSNGTATVRLGVGDGSFSSATSYLMESLVSQAVAVGDVNGDGVLDLVTAGRSASSDGTATVRLGTGDGSFGEASSFATETFASFALSLGDINGDGILDLVSAGRDDSSNGYATVSLGVGDGSFQGAVSFATESLTSWAVDLGDVNGDGNLDLVTAGQLDSNDGFANVRLGNGDGTFSGPTSFETEARSSYQVELGDLNGDGFLDLVTSGRDDINNGVTTVRLGTGTGAFGSATTLASDTFTSNSASLGDIDGDGVLDLITAGQTDGATGSATVRLGRSVAGVSPILEFSLETIADARQALPVFQRKRDQLAQQRGEIGASQARVEVASTVLGVASESFRAAESRIRDADIATEAASLTRLQILQQASASVLAQANQQPALAISLLS